MSTTITPISKRDVEIFRSAVFASKALNNPEKLKNRLKDYYCNNPQDPTTALSFGIFSILPSRTKDPLELKDGLEDAIDAFEKVLAHDPGHWLARFYKARLQALFCDYYGEEESIIEEINQLIDWQNQSEHRPYFVLPYMLMADVLLTSAIGSPEEALRYIAKAESLPRKPVEELSDLLGFIFIEMENKLKLSGEDDLAGRVGQMGREYFPEIM